MIVKLDDLDLVLLKHTDDEPSNPIQELRSIRSVWTSDRRHIVEHKVPGREASALQDLGRRSVRFAMAGELIGPDAKTAAENLWAKFQHGQIVPFTSDIVSLSGIAKVVIEQLECTDYAGDVNRFNYTIVLREHRDPPQKEEPAPAQADEASDSVDDETEEAAAGVNYITGKVVDAEGNPVKDAKAIIKGDPGEFEATTDETGVFRQDNLEPGTYEVNIDQPGYENQKRKVEIKAGEATEEEPEEAEAPGAS